MDSGKREIFIDINSGTYKMVSGNPRLSLETIAPYHFNRILCYYYNNDIIYPKEGHGMSEYLSFKSRQEFREWLTNHCLSSDGVWLLFDKTSKHETLKASEALEEALCFGWIDGQIKAIDENSYKKYFSLRRANSKWSKKNKGLVIALEKKGVMTEYGRDKIEEAKNNGQWQKVNTVVIEEQDIALLMAELKDIEPAYTNFLAMSLSVKKTYTKAYLDPKTTDGKYKRIQWIIERLNNNLKPM